MRSVCGSCLPCLPSSSRVRRAGWLLALVALLTTAPHRASAADDYSRAFRFGLLRGGVIRGWPGGHTTTAVAMATTLAPGVSYRF